MTGKSLFGAASEGETPHLLRNAVTAVSSSPRLRQDQEATARAGLGLLGAGGKLSRDPGTRAACPRHDRWQQGESRTAGGLAPLPAFSPTGTPTHFLKHETPCLLPWPHPPSCHGRAQNADKRRLPGRERRARGRWQHDGRGSVDQGHRRQMHWPRPPGLSHRNGPSRGERWPAQGLQAAPRGLLSRCPRAGHTEAMTEVGTCLSTQAAGAPGLAATWRSAVKGQRSPRPSAAPGGRRRRHLP